MAKEKLDREEQALLDAYDSDDFVSDLDNGRRDYLAKVAEETFKKDKRINIRIASRDLAALQRRALEEGLPYQSLVSSVFISMYPEGSRMSFRKSL